MDKKAKSREMTVKIAGTAPLSATVISPMFACVRIISRKEEMTVALEDLMDRPMNSAINPMVTTVTDFEINSI